MPVRFCTDDYNRTAVGWLTISLTLSSWQAIELDHRAEDKHEGT